MNIYHIHQFIYHTHDDFDSADPSSMQDACQKRTQLNDLLSMRSRSSVERTPARCSGGHGFDSCLFSLSHDR